MKKLGKLTLNELKIEMPLICTEEANCLKGGTYSGADGTTWYTEDEMDSMMESGNWKGGYVDGMGYVMEPVTITGSKTPQNTYSCWLPYSYSVMTYQEYAESLTGSAIEEGAEEGLQGMQGAVSKALDMLNTALEIFASDLIGMQQEMSNDLLRLGYASESKIYFAHKLNCESLDHVYTIYDAESGDLITSYQWNPITGHEKIDGMLQSTW